MADKPTQLLPELPGGRVTTEIANTPAFSQVSLTLAFFPDLALHPNYRHFVEATEDHFRHLEVLSKETEENRNG